MSEEQRVLIKEAFDNIRIYLDNFMMNLDKVFKEDIKPIVDRIKSLLKNKPKLKIKYRPIKIIPVNSYIGIIKLNIFHCRNNC